MKRWFSRLQVRMAFSYATVSVLIILMFEVLISSLVYFALTRSPLLGQLAQYRAQVIAQNYALEAAVQSNGTTLDPHSTFQPGKPASIVPPQGEISVRVSPILGPVPYEAGSSPAGPPAMVALLVAPGGQVVASSYPARYPAASSAGQVLPGDAQLIDDALRGKAGHQVESTGRGPVAVAAETVWSKPRQPMGAVYLQVPVGTPPGSLMTDIAFGWVRSALGWLILMLPVGMLFGLITARPLVRRIQRLVEATAAFSQGDYSQRVLASSADEIGQLERQFNRMAEQLVGSMHREQAAIEHSARREERARIEQELRTARYIQQSLLPRQVPAFSGWQLAPYYQPAREVGGDLYDFISLPGEKLGIVIGDATDKGVAAALVMAATCTMLRSAAPHTLSPGDVLAQLNNLLHRDIPPGMFVTCFYAILDPRTGQLRYANAGHDLPYRLRAGSLLELRATGMPLGLMPDMPYEEFEISIEPDETILLYTDGLVEAHNPAQEMIGFPRLKTWMQAYHSSTTLIQDLLDELHHFTGESWEQEDDVTIVLLKRD